MRMVRHPAVVLLIGVLVGASVGYANEGATTKPVHEVHAFYYPWYGNPTTDESWHHWNEGGHKPPEDIGANFYPALGLYSSNNPKHVAAQMRQLRDGGVDVICTSWWGRGHFTDKVVPLLLEEAGRCGLKVNVHVEPFAGRKGPKASQYRTAMVHLIETYGRHAAFYRSARHGNRPMFYVYDSYLVKPADWATILAPDGKDTIRGTAHDAVVIGLYVKGGDSRSLLDGRFDGFYTYFATEGFTYGSTPTHWKAMSRFARRHGLEFIPSVGPGYDDTRIRPWNSVNQRDRRNGAYYDAMWRSAIAVGPRIVSITSFNEWHEGTQIEPALPKRIKDYTYLDYKPRRPDYYLVRTRHWADALKGARSP